VLRTHFTPLHREKEILKVRENSRLKTNVGECKEGWTQRTSGILDFVASKEKERRRHVILPSLYCIIEINQQIPEFLDARFLSKHHVPTGRHDVALARAKKDSTLYEDRPLLLLFTLALALARSIYLSIYLSIYILSISQKDARTQCIPCG
jgi:hypothetical protein